MHWAGCCVRLRGHTGLRKVHERWTLCGRYMAGRSRVYAECTKGVWQVRATSTGAQW